jgi:hypothetical protein
MDRNYQKVATIRAGNGYEADLHDFQISAHDVAYITAYNLMRCDLSRVGGTRNGVIVDAAVQELDMQTGLVRSEWHSLDHVAVSESHTPVPTTAIPWDWFHLNSVEHEPDGSLVISARNAWAAYRLARGSGKIVWRLGGTNSSFKMGPGTEVAWAHDARVQRDRTVTLFDDGSNPRVHDQSRGVRVAIDTNRHTARLVHAYRHPGSPLLSDSQGNAQILPDDSVVIGWGSVPSVSELANGGALLFDAHLPAGTSFYRAFRFPWAGHPLWPPAASASVLATGDSTAVFASWNGDSEVRSWRVLAGSDQGSLIPRATMPDSAFESSITLPEAYAYVAVQALGARGDLLATSPTVRVQNPPTPTSSN